MSSHGTMAEQAKKWQLFVHKYLNICTTLILVPYSNSGLTQKGFRNLPAASFCDLNDSHPNKTQRTHVPNQLLYIYTWWQISFAFFSANSKLISEEHPSEFCLSVCLSVSVSIWILSHSHCCLSFHQTSHFFFSLKALTEPKL